MFVLRLCDEMAFFIPQTRVYTVTATLFSRNKQKFFCLYQVKFCNALLFGSAET